MENQISRRRLLIALGALPLVGACGGSSSDPVVNHYIRAGASGTKDGSSWANAWPTFASVTWTRGHTYYVAGGTYTENPIITKALSGTTWIYVKKANETDNGSDAGWSLSYATTVAQINGTLQLWNGYIDFDGVTGSATSGHGIKVYTASSAAAICVRLDEPKPYRFAHVEVQGAGYSSSTGQDALYACFPSPSSPGKGIHIDSCWLHDVTRDGITFLGLVGTSYLDYGFLLENTWITETGGCTDLSVHGQGMVAGYSVATTYSIIRNCLFRNTVGTGAIAFLGNTPGETYAVYSNIQISNNVFVLTDNTTYKTLSPGPIFVSESCVSMTNLTVANNTFYGIGPSSTGGAKAQCVSSAPTQSGIVLQNNLWETCYFSATNSGFNTQTNNGYYNNTGVVPSGTTNQVNGSASAFTNAPAGDFSLASGSYAIGAGVGGVDLGATGTVIISSSSKG